MALSSLTGNLTATANWTAQNNLTGSTYNPVQNSSRISKSCNIGTAAANAAAGGADQLFSFQQTISAAGSATIDLYAMTNILQQTSQAIVRLKGYMIQLLDATDDSTITTPVAASMIVTNNGPALPNPLDFNTYGSGLTLALTTSGGAIGSVAIGAAGSGYLPSSTFMVAPNQSGGSGGVIAVTTNSSGVPTTVALVAGAGGSGYSNATVPSTVLGQYLVLGGGIHFYVDVSAGGFAAVSSTSRNIKLFNTNASGTATAQLTFFGGSD